MSRAPQPAPSSTLALWATFLLCALAAIFAAGNLSTDDHFFVVHVAGQWLHGQPVLLRDAQPPSRSLLWPGMIYGGLWLARSLGLEDPSRQMVVVRLLQAWAAVVLVWLIGKHALALGRPRGAALARWMVGGFYFMPFLLVRQLFEIGCLPFLAGALFLLDPGVPRDPLAPRLGERPAALLGGALMALAIIIRPQVTLLLAGGTAILLWRRRWSTLALMLVGLAMVAAAEGWMDFHLWGQWFAPQVAYLKRNLLGFGLVGQEGYVSGPWWKYAAFLTLFLLPPLSVLLFYGAFRGARKTPFVAAGALAFLVGHSLFPGKQERFIIPVLPHLFLLASIGLAREGVGARLRGWRWVWGLGLAANLTLLPMWIANYTQRARIESVRAAAARPDARAFLVLQTEHAAADVPDFYLYPRRPYLSVQDTTALSGEQVRALEPNYAVLYGDRNEERWLAALEAAGYHPAFVRHFAPSAVDDFFHWINPYRNHSRSATLYRI